MTPKKIIVVEDEPDILETICYNLEREGFEVLSSLRGDTGLQLIFSEKPDVVLLDLMMPGMDGLEVCSAMRKNPETQHIPVLMVSAKSEESDIVLGLGLGADDYIPKPFSPKELVARVKAILRRSEPTPAEHSLSDERIICGPLEINRDSVQVKLNGQGLQLTLTEFKIIQKLASQPGRAFSREQIIKHASGENVVVIDRNVDVHIRALRKALDKYQHLIETVRGVGYRLNCD